MDPSRYETEDGEPRYGARLNPEELEAYLREQGIEPPARRPGVGPGTQAPDPALRRPGSQGNATTAPTQAVWRPGAGEVDPYVAPPGVPAPPGAPGTPGSEAAPEPARVPPGPASVGPLPPAVPPRRRRWRLLVLGLVLLIVVPGALTVGATVYAVGGGLAGAVPLGPSGTVYLEAGTTSMIYSAEVGASTADCTVADPAGSAVDVVSATELAYGRFTSAGAGAYTVSCPGGTRGVIVGPAIDESRLGVAGGLVLGAVVTGLTGLVLSALGLVRVLSARRR